MVGDAVWCGHNRIFQLRPSRNDQAFVCAVPEIDGAQSNKARSNKATRFGRLVGLLHGCHVKSMSVSSSLKKGLQSPKQGLQNRANSMLAQKANLTTNGQDLEKWELNLRAGFFRAGEFQEMLPASAASLTKQNRTHVEHHAGTRVRKTSKARPR